MTPYKAVKKHCRQCMNGQNYEVAKCTSINCYWYNWRFKKQPGSTIKAIRKYCLDEYCGNENAVKRVEACNTLLDCALYPFRMGKNPNPVKLTDERRKELAERMRQLNKMRSKAIISL